VDRYAGPNEACSCRCRSGSECLLNCVTRRKCGDVPLPVPDLTRGGDIKLNERFSLQRHAVAISFADDARAPLEFSLCGHLGCGGGRLALVSVRLCRTRFSTVNKKATAVNHLTRFFPSSRLWASIVTLSCAGIIAVGAMALIAWVAWQCWDFSASFGDKSASPGLGAFFVAINGSLAGPASSLASVFRQDRQFKFQN